MSAPDEDKVTAQVSSVPAPLAVLSSILLLTPHKSHSPSTQPLPDAFASTNNDLATAPEPETPPPEADDDGLDLGLTKKKKKKAKKEDDGEGAGDDAAAGDDGGLSTPISMHITLTRLAC